jgi:Protein of unknown function (DUF2889)
MCPEDVRGHPVLTDGPSLTPVSGAPTGPAPGPPVTDLRLDLPPESIQRHKSVGLWYEDDELRVSAHLRDAYLEPDGDELVMHEYRLDLWVDLATMVLTRVEVEPIALPYEECFDAPAYAQRLVGLKLERGFTGEALARLVGECGCTHLNALIADLSIAGLFHGYIRVREHARTQGTLPEMPPSAERTGICSGWRSGGTLATWMEDGRGIAPSRVYPMPDAP